jgi:hypothetical protein
MQLRFRGYAGGVIAPHRALLTLPRRIPDLVIAILLSIIILTGWLMILPQVSSLWQGLFEWWIDALKLDASVSSSPYQIGSYLLANVPYIQMTAGVPDCFIWSLSLFVTAIIFYLPQQYLPFVYLLRAVAIILAASLSYFALFPSSYSYNLADYHMGMMSAGLVLISIVPILFGFAYYIFDFTIRKKLFLTFLLMAHLCLLIPMQYLLQVYLLHHFSLLFMPIMFFLLGLPLDILIVIAFYSWGMSWKGRDESAHVQHLV